MERRLLIYEGNPPESLDGHVSNQLFEVFQSELRFYRKLKHLKNTLGREFSKHVRKVFEFVDRTGVGAITFENLSVFL